MAGKETENILQSDQKNLKLKSHGQVRLILKSEIESRHENQQHINCEERKSYKSSSNNYKQYNSDLQEDCEEYSDAELLVKLF